jgi:hypothetical protein
VSVVLTLDDVRTVRWFLTAVAAHASAETSERLANWIKACHEQPVTIAQFIVAGAALEQDAADTTKERN